MKIPSFSLFIGRLALDLSLVYGISTVLIFNTVCPANRPEPVLPAPLAELAGLDTAPVMSASLATDPQNLTNIGAAVAPSAPAKPAKRPKAAKTNQPVAAKPAASQQTPKKAPEDPEDGTAYRVLQQFAGSVFQFSRIVADPENPTTVKSALCAMLAHWVQIFAEITRQGTEFGADQPIAIDTVVSSSAPISASPATTYADCHAAAQTNHIPAGLTAQVLDQHKFQEIQQFVATLDQETRANLLTMALYLYATEAQLELA